MILSAKQHMEKFRKKFYQPFISWTVVPKSFQGTPILNKIGKQTHTSYYAGVCLFENWTNLSATRG
jgi:hypothetical protein